jgi:hypothetical protein
VLGFALGHPSQRKSLIFVGWVEGRNPIPPAAGLNPTYPQSGLFVQALAISIGVIICIKTEYFPLGAILIELSLAVKTAPIVWGQCFLLIPFGSIPKNSNRLVVLSYREIFKVNHEPFLSNIKNLVTLFQEIGYEDLCLC